VETEVVVTPWGVLEAFCGDLITEQLREWGAHQRSDLALLLSLLRRGDHVIDVGAHIGTYTIPIARTVGPQGGVTAIEPIPEHFAVLSRNVARNGLDKTVRTVNALITECDREGEMLASPGNTGSAHFIVGSGANMHTLRLDDVAPQRTKLVKLDVEGMEVEVLRSGAGMIERDQPILVFEAGAAAASELDAFCRSIDYLLLINLHERSGPDDSFRAAHLSKLTGRFIGPLPLLDIVAIPPRSDRWPSDLVSSSRAHSILVARRARVEAGRTARRVLEAVKHRHAAHLGPG
jgi:FkbM family methyltransferase